MFDEPKPPRKTPKLADATPAGSPRRGIETTREGEQPRLGLDHLARRHQPFQPVPNPFDTPGHRRILTQRGDHIPAPHRPTRRGEDRQQLIHEHRFRP